MLKLRILLLSNYLYIFILLLTCIYSFLFIKNFNYKSKYNQDTKIIEGIITNYKIDGKNLVLDIKALEKLKVTYIINTEEEKSYLLKNIKYGITITLNGEFEKPLNNTIPNTFNYKKYLARNKIYWIFNADNYSIKYTNIPFYYKIKNLIQKQINKSKKSGPYIDTFLFGNKNNIDYDAIKNYQKNGISHLFALSGMHVSLFTGIIISLLKKLKIKEIKRYIIATGFILFYTALANFVPSISRATLFFILLSLDKIFYTHIKMLNLLILTGCILTVINPFVIYDLGFQYSFVTSFGLILNRDKISNKNYFISLLKVSIIAFLFSIPISLYNFYEINIFSIINNLFFVPFITFIMYPISLITFLFPIVDNIMYFFIYINEYLNKLFSNITFMNIIVPKIPISLIILYYLSLILNYLKSRKFILVSILIICYLKIKPFFDSNYYIYYLDVGQGDCTLIRYAHNKEVIMIDTGGRIEYNKEDWEVRNKEYHISDNYLTFFKSIGISKIDTLILTHGDEDHVGETKNLINNFKVKNIVINKGKINKQEKEIISNFKNVSINKIETLFKIKQLNNYENVDENENSQVLLIEIKNYNFLFMGDVGHSTERKIMKDYLLPQITFLKLGHHGSKNSSSEEFLKYVNSKNAIISAGRNNRYNHPAPIIMEYLEKLGINYFNTISNGTIEIVIRHNAYTQSIYPP